LVLCDVIFELLVNGCCFTFNISLVPSLVQFSIERTPSAAHVSYRN